jgi:hypothetical protein
MYGLFNPFWWRTWTRRGCTRTATYARLRDGAAGGDDAAGGPYTAVKFYFNDCFPAPTEPRVRAPHAAGARGSRPVVSLATGCASTITTATTQALGVQHAAAPSAPAQQPWRCRRRVAGRARSSAPTAAFSYWRRFSALRATAYYATSAFSRRHLAMAVGARSLGAGDLSTSTA